jgi:threonine/homoserine/homoserine lactone efflux protein
VGRKPSGFGVPVGALNVGLAKSFLSGGVLGVLVSIAPGANMGLCVSLARQRLRDALPLIVAAALTDFCYALLCSLGLLGAIGIDPHILAWLSVLLLALAAILLWPAGKRRIGVVSAVGIAALNPSTAALWIGMSATVISSEHLRAEPVALALGTLIATGSWFLGLGYVSSRLRSSPSDSDRGRRTFSLALLAFAVLHLLELIG